MPAISIVMPCYNSAHSLARTLDAYDRQKMEEPFELIAIDDASSDETYKELTSYRPTRYEPHIERMKKNSGPAKARNRGIELAKSPLILIVGDDILPSENLVQGHLTAHRCYQNPGVAVLGRVTWPEDFPVNTLMSHIDGIGAQQFSYHYFSDGQVYDYRHFYTANISIRKKLLSSINHWFDTQFRFAAYEDTELAYRLSKHGLRIIYTSPLIGYHYHYHNIFSFSKRQRTSGFMATVLTSKHPGLRYAFRAQYLRILNLLRTPKAILYPKPIETMDQLVNFTLQLASYYEWYPNKLLDRLYLSVLDYFYYDGVIEGFFGQSNFGTRMKSAHAIRYLIPSLKSFLTNAEKLKIPAPTEYHPAILGRFQ